MCYLIKHEHILNTTSMYPSLLVAFNIAKETKQTFALEIQNHSKEEMEDFFSGVSSPIENSVDLCSRFFNLPNYDEMEKMVS